MKLNGREVHFRRTILATNAIMKMCPGEDLNRLTELFAGSQADQILTMSAFITIMSEADEQARAFEAQRKGEAYEKDPVTMDEIMALEDMDVLVQLSNEAMEAWVKDSEVTVESAPHKTKKKAKAAEGPKQ